MKKMIKLSCWVFVACILLVACKDNKPATGKWRDTITTGMIPIAVDESFEPIIQAELDVFEMIYPFAAIDPVYTTEKEAVQLLLDDSVRFVVASRPFSATEKKLLSDKKRYPQEWKIATDAIALIINKSNPDSLISISMLKKILSGEISKWREINPKSPLTGDINVVFDNKESGTIRHIIDSICGGIPLSENIYAEKKNKDVIDYVAESPHAMGVIGVNWVGSDSDSTRTSKKFNDRVTVMAVGRMEHPNVYNTWKPYQAYIALKDYPLTRDVYILLNDPKSGLSSGLTSFICSQRGQFIILKSGLVPATQEVRIRSVEINP
ncbi:MAG: substrate-binding domain-containing protein [Dysgonamonadaceae bacterium]|jgi:phosphate transport system substrate-binding protein|nr:substrate-binding domain-containing protein [Dysgonamonadaceae bacterium]